MNFRLLLGLCVSLAGCPERREPERGLQLVYKKPNADSVRSVVDRRLAQLKLRANLSEDESTLTVRVKEGADLSRIKALFAQAGRLEFCPEDIPIATRWCETTWPTGITAEGLNSACSLRGTRRALEATLADAGVDFVVESKGIEASAFVIASCLSPRIISADLREEPASLALEFDRSGARDFGALTTTLVGHRLIIRLNGVLHSAPVVQQAITGGKAMLTTGSDDRATVEVLAAALVGGSLSVMELQREETWGPPTFGR